MMLVLAQKRVSTNVGGNNRQTRGSMSHHRENERVEKGGDEDAWDRECKLVELPKPIRNEWAGISRGGPAGIGSNGGRVEKRLPGVWGWNYVSSRFELGKKRRGRRNTIACGGQAIVY